jgi:hypothetical protein
LAVLSPPSPTSLNHKGLRPLEICQHRGPNQVNLWNVWGRKPQYVVYLHVRCNTWWGRMEGEESHSQITVRVLLMFN